MYCNPLTAAHGFCAEPVWPAQRGPGHEFVFLIQDDTVAFAAQSCIHVLQTANRLTGRDSYRWQVHHEAGLGDGFPPLCGPDQTLVLVGGSETPWCPAPGHLALLRKALRNAGRVCVVGSAVFVPLATGALAAKCLSVHPRFRPGVCETEAGIDIHPDATCHQGTLSSATGPASAIRMMVELVGQRDGGFAQTALARDLGLLGGDEHPGHSDETWRLIRRAAGCTMVRDALDIMADHLEDTLSVGQIASLLGVSSRKLERGFADRLERSPLKVYRDLRLERANSLLQQTVLPLREIALACGFSSVTLMKRWFLEKYGAMPSNVRRRAFGHRCEA